MAGFIPDLYIHIVVLCEVNVYYVKVIIESGDKH